MISIIIPTLNELPLSGGKQTFDLNVRFSADYVRFSPKSGRIDTVTVKSARDPKQTFAMTSRMSENDPQETFRSLDLGSSPRAGVRFSRDRSATVVSSAAV